MAEFQLQNRHPEVVKEFNNGMLYIDLTQTPLGATHGKSLLVALNYNS